MLRFKSYVVKFILIMKLYRYLYRSMWHKYWIFSPFPVDTKTCHLLHFFLLFFLPWCDCARDNGRFGCENGRPKIESRILIELYILEWNTAQRTHREFPWGEVEFAVRGDIAHSTSRLHLLVCFGYTRIFGIVWVYTLRVYEWYQV